VAPMSTHVRAICFILTGFFVSVQEPQRAQAGAATVQRQSSVSSCDGGDHPGSHDEVHLGQSAQATLFEDEVLRLVNDARSHGAECGAYGHFAPTRSVLMHPLLRCAARKHAQDMATRQYFSHHSPEGQTPWRRMREAGYGSYRFAAENIAVGSERPRQVIDRLMQDPPHCANIMSSKFTHIGVGYAPGAPQEGPLDTEETYRHLTVQDFATPP
jgi:uncharacterized protein YkwD